MPKISGIALDHSCLGQAARQGAAQSVILQRSACLPARSLAQRPWPGKLTARGLQADAPPRGKGARAGKPSSRLGEAGAAASISYTTPCNHCELRDSSAGVPLTLVRMQRGWGLL